jgi:hypothetical protein
MRNLIINKLVYTILTDDKSEYGATIPFNKGLNVIYGPNSVGKTSIITGIIYGLGAEKGLGVFKSIQNPFKPEFYKEIDKKNIAKSFLILEISNGTKTISIFRYIKGGDINICAIKECEAKLFFKTEKVNKFIISGEGVFSKNGFQNYLFNFLDIKQVELPTYDQKFSKLYFENIIPLFFVEQRAGWSQIQARQVTRYNIKDIKKVVFEYIMGLDRFNLHLIELKKKDIEGLIKKNKEELERKEENLLIIANAENIDDVPILNIQDRGKTSIYDYIRYLEEKYKLESSFINEFTSKNKEYEDTNTRLRDDLKRSDYDIRKLNDQIEKITIEISGYENYLDRIQKNKYKNKQLKKIQELSSGLNIKTCPICETDLEDPHDDSCHLCHTDKKKKFSSTEQNLLFLEDEEKTFKKVITQRILDRKKILEKRDEKKDKISLYEKQLNHQTSTYAGEEFAKLREKILQVDSTFKEKEKYKRISERWNDLKPLRVERDALKKRNEALKEEIEKYTQTESDLNILKSIQKHFKNNVKEMGLFKSNHKLISKIKIDANDNYMPYLDDFDIYNISSSSDNIRIILSYYLSLLQTSIEKKSSKNIKYPNILILDEPRQQNLDNASLLNCIEQIEKIPMNNSQVILTTYSELDSDRERLKKHINYEMKSSTDYLLKKINGKL